MWVVRLPKGPAERVPAPIAGRRRFARVKFWPRSLRGTRRKKDADGISRVNRSKFMLCGRPVR